MTLDLTAILFVLAVMAVAVVAGWWTGRRRASALEAERALALDRAMEQLDRRFDDLAGRQLRENIENFLRLAKENLGSHQVSAQGALKEREQAIEALVKPIQESLTKTSDRTLLTVGAGYRDARGSSPVVHRRERDVDRKPVRDHELLPNAAITLRKSSASNPASTRIVAGPSCTLSPELDADRERTILANTGAPCAEVEADASFIHR